MMETKFFWEKCRLRKGKIRGKIRLLALAAFFILLAGCGGNGGSKEEFSAYLNQIFRSEVTGSTLNMHYNLAHPENYGITDYKVTYGNVSAGRDTEAAAVLENWKKNLKRFRKKDLPVSQQMAYDILEDYILQELPAGKFSLYQEILKPSTGFQSQLP